MATTISTIETLARRHLEETTPKFWTSAELVSHVISGIKDLWREVVDLKEEHFLTEDVNVTLAANSSSLTSVPSDIHKVYLIEPLDSSNDSDNIGLEFDPLNYNDREFRVARSLEAVDPKDTVIYYAVIGAGSPVAAPTVKVAPQVTSAVSLRFVYIPTVSSSLTGASDVPIPGESDNALVAWTVANARAKEREDRAPDPGWMRTYKDEKDRLVKSLGVRNLQEPVVVDAIFKEYH